MRIVDDDGFELMEHDPVTGRNIWSKVEGGELIVRVYQKGIGAIIDANHEAKMATEGRRFGDWNRVASVPHHLAYTTGLTAAIDQQDNKWLSRFLNDSEHEGFRTSRGKV
jgi:hypothetical protein